MIEVGIVDLSAEGRRRLAGLVERWSWVNPDSKNLTLPRLSLHLLSPEEVRFHGSIDVCLVGPELVSCDVAHLGVLRRQLPGKILMCVLDGRSYSFGMIEQLGRLEVDDVLMDSASSDEFFRRLILLKRRVSNRSRGRLVIVDSARGGVGATFVAAGLSETLSSKEKKVCLVDSDTLSSDLTRFLQCRPFVNEPFKILLDQQRVVTAETVKECVFPVWADEPHLLCVPPPAASDEAAFSSPQACRTLLSVLEVLQTLNDAIVVDASPMTLGVRQALYQVADDVVFVLNKDPAGAFASRHVLSLISGHIRRDARLIAVVNDLRNGGAPLSALRDCIAVPGDRAVRMVTIPFSSRAGRWPCSGYTPSRYLRKYFAKILPDALDQSEERNTSLETPWESILHERGANFLKAIFRRLHRKKTNEGHGVDASRPSAAVRHGHGALPLLTGPAPEDELVSKPVLAG